MGRKKKQEDDSDNEAYIGRRVEKNFEGFGKYTGSVVAYNAARRFYKVVYDDGDREELELHELEPILKLAEDEVPATGKRGRLSKKQELQTERKRQRTESFRKQGTSGTGRRDREDLGCTGRKRSLAEKRFHGDQSDQDVGEVEVNALSLVEDRKNGAVGQPDDKGELLSVRASKRRRQRQDQDFAATFRAGKSAFSTARGRTIQNQSLVQLSEDASDEDDSGGYLDENETDNDDETSTSDGDVTAAITEEPTLPTPVTLPPSSQNFPLPEDLVAEAFSVYSFLRSFSHALFLSPFTFDDFICALIAERANHLIDSIHLILLQALRRHLQRLRKDDCKQAKECLRQLDWNLLDNVTWPSFLMVYLATQCFGKFYGQSIGSLHLLDAEYYKASTKVKLSVLSFLCDHALETEEIRAVIDARELEVEGQVEQKDVIAVNSKPSDVQEVQIGLATKGQGVKSDTAHEVSNLLSGTPNSAKEESFLDGNSDECVLCGMNGNLICCDGCPAAYHSRCVGIARASLPPGEWFCPECIVDKIGGEQSTRKKGLEGAHSLGMDSYGRTFVVTCGHLLVLNSTDETQFKCSYYNEHDVMPVLQTLESQGPLCTSVASAIRHYWDIATPLIFPENGVVISDSMRGVLSEEQSRPDQLIQEISQPTVHEFKGGENEQHKEASCVETTAVNACNDTSSADVIVSVTNSPSNAKFMVEAAPDEPANSPSKSNVLVETTPDESRLELGVVADTTAGVLNGMGLVESSQHLESGAREKLSMARVSVQTQYTHLGSFEQDPFLAQKIVDRDTKGRFLTAASREPLPSESVHKLTSCENRHADQVVKIKSYTNHYVFGDAAATAAANLALMTSDEAEPPEKDARKLRKTGTTIAEQISAFCRAPPRFCWPSLRKKLMEAPKDRCGWCFSCLSCMKRGCLLNQSASLLAAGASRVSGGIRPGKYGHGHLPAIIGYILHMEEVLQSFLDGPWENAIFRKHWRKKVEQALSLCDVKASLLHLEANLRQVLLTEDWSKLPEDAPCVAFRASITYTEDSISRKASGKKNFRRSGAWRQNFSKGGNRSLGNVQWARRGKVMHRVLGWATLATKPARKAGRQGGLKNIEGVLYDNNEEVPRRTKQTAWRARVQAACTIAELAVQVRSLDCLVRWDDLSSKSEVHATPKAIEENGGKDNTAFGVHAKSVHDHLVMYLTDSKLVPRQSQRQSALPALPKSCNSQQVWVEERQLPLHLLKEFEEKERLSKQSQAPKLASLQKYLTETKRQHKKDIFKFLCERAGFSTTAKVVMSVTCKLCSSKVLAGLAVQCHVCKESFHVDCTVTSHAIGKPEIKHTCKGCLKTLVQTKSTLLNGVKQESAVCSLKGGRENSQLAVHPQNYQKKIIISQPRPQALAKLPVKLPLRASILGVQGTDDSKEFSQGWHTNAAKGAEKNLMEGVYWKKNGMNSRMRFEKNLLFPIEGDQFKDAPKCFVCKQQFEGNLIYVKCEYCPLWFHGDAVGVKTSNLDEVLGFKCNKCRKKAVPSCPFGTSSRSQKRIIHATPIVLGRSILGQEPCVTKRSPLPFLKVSDNRVQQQMTVTGQKVIPVVTAELSTIKPLITNGNPLVSAELGTIKPLISNHWIEDVHPHLGLQLFQWPKPSNPLLEKCQLKSQSEPSTESLQHVIENITMPQVLDGRRDFGSGYFPIKLPSIEHSSKQKYFDQNLDVKGDIDCTSSEDVQYLSDGDDEAQFREDDVEDGSTNGESSAQPTLSFMELLSSEDDRVEELAEVAMDFGADGFDVFDVDTILGNLGNMDPQTKEDLGQLSDLVSSGAGIVNSRRSDEVHSICGDAPQQQFDLHCIGCGLNIEQHCLNAGKLGTGMWLAHGWACDACKGGFLRGQG